METIGLIKKGKVEKSYYGQGFIYKNFDAFEKQDDRVCYIPELSDNQYRFKDFLMLAENKLKELGSTADPLKLAKNLFDTLDWQSPETLLEEMTESDEF